MHFKPATTTVIQAFLQPLQSVLLEAVNLWHCPQLPDDEWLRMGVTRVLEASVSGRAFLQEHGQRFERPPTTTNYFASLHSPRRTSLLEEVCQKLRDRLDARLTDRLACFPELDGYACFAADGHWHKAATHDPRHASTKMAVGHFYSLNLRTHTLKHLVTGEGLHEHDLSALKRCTPRGLRQDVRTGTRVLLVYDRAGLDFDYWNRCRRECALYFLSLVKKGLVLERVAERAWDRADGRNQGVLADTEVRTAAGHRLRVVQYQDAASAVVYEFLTNEQDLAPGLVAELYRRRWEVEKVFDEVKNKLGQTKAWGTSLATKGTQAKLIALTHNLLVGYEQDLEERRGVTNRAEDQRRGERLAATRQACEQKGQPMPTLREGPPRTTQRSVKFIRWLRQAIRQRLAEGAALAHLTYLYAQL